MSVDYNKTVFKAAHYLVLLAAIQLGLLGLFDYDLIGLVLGGFPSLARLLFILIGASGVYELTTHVRR